MKKHQLLSYFICYCRDESRISREMHFGRSCGDYDHVTFLLRNRNNVIPTAEKGVLTILTGNNFKIIIIIVV